MLPGKLWHLNQFIYGYIFVSSFFSLFFFFFNSKHAIKKIFVMFQVLILGILSQEVFQDFFFLFFYIARMIVYIVT